MSKGGYPSFEEAVERMSRFLSQNDRPTKIVWAQKDASSIYNAAVEKNLGVMLQCLESKEQKSHCQVWSPIDETEADYALIGKCLKLSICIDGSSAVIPHNNTLEQPGDA